MGYESNSLEWDIEFPDRASSFSNQTNRAKLHMVTKEFGNETLYIPRRVGRTLATELKKQPVHSRNELVYKLKEVSQQCIKERIEKLLVQREYSRKELFDKLKTDGYRNELIEERISRAVEVGLIKDSRFADVFIRSKIGMGWGQVRIKRELSLKGIDVSTLDGWPEDYFNDEDEYERCLEVAYRKRLTGKNDFEKIVRACVTRGFSSSMAFKAAKERLREESAE